MLCMLIDSCICMIDEWTLVTYNLIRSFYAKVDCRTIMFTSLISRGYPSWNFLPFVGRENIQDSFLTSPRRNFDEK